MKTEIKLNEGGRVVNSEETQEEIDDANARTQIENAENLVNEIERLRQVAIQAELEPLIDLETGTTTEAIAYRTLRDA